MMKKEQMLFFRPTATRPRWKMAFTLRSRLAQDNDNVKQKFSFDDEDNNGRQLSDGKRSYFKNSVVRDDKGRLLTVYHGTDADFTVFDIMRAGKNGRAEGYGFYFSDDQEITGKYGDRQMEVYLNITKPLYSDRRTLTKQPVFRPGSIAIYKKGKIRYNGRRRR